MPPLFLEKNKRVPLHLIKQDFVKLSYENRRLTFHVSMSLDEGNNLMGLPDWIQNFYAVMVKSANKGKKQVFDTAIHNCFVEMFGTSGTKQKLFPIVNEATLSGFYMERTGKDDEDIAVKLCFKISFAARKEIYDWAYDTKKATFYAQFEESQRELYEGDEPAADGDTYEEGDEDEDEAVQENLPITETREQKRKREAAALATAKSKLAIM